jgi:hypothetical protein
MQTLHRSSSVAVDRTMLEDTLMKSRLALPGLVLLFSVTSVVTAGAAAADPTQPNACFGAYASSFAQENPASGRIVSGIATSQPGAVGQVASEKPAAPTGCQ